MIHWSLIWHKVPVCQIGLPLSFVSLNIKREIVTFGRIRPGKKPGFKFIPIFVKKTTKKVSKNGNRQSAKNVNENYTIFN